MVVCQWITGYIVVYPRTTGYYDLFGQFQTVYRNMGGGGGGGVVKSMKDEAEPSLPYILQTRHICIDRLELTK